MIMLMMMVVVMMTSMMMIVSEGEGEGAGHLALDGLRLHLALHVGLLKVLDRDHRAAQLVHAHLDRAEGALAQQLTWVRVRVRVRVRP